MKKWANEDKEKKESIEKKTLKEKENLTKVETSFAKNLIDIECDIQELEDEEDEKNDKSFIFKTPYETSEL